MEFKGTKGKWELDTYGGQGSVIDIMVSINDDEDAQIAQVYSLKEMCYKEFQNEEHKANAKLIASAPEMFETVKDLLNELQFHGFNNSVAIYNAKQLLTKITT